MTFQDTWLGTERLHRAVRNGCNAYFDTVNCGYPDKCTCSEETQKEMANFAIAVLEAWERTDELK